jgi:hypothetical protein
VFFLAGCMDAEDPWGEWIDPPQDTIFFNYTTLTYTTLNDSDLLNQLGTPTTDYMMFLDQNGIVLSDTQTTAYEDTLLLLEELNEQTAFSYSKTLTYTSEEIYTMAERAHIEITAANIFMYDELKNTQSMITELNGSVQRGINRYDYYEYLLDRDLTDTEIAALSIFQDYFYEVYIEIGGPPVSIEDTTETIITTFETYLNRTFTDDERTQLALAHDVLIELHSD